MRTSIDFAVYNSKNLSIFHDKENELLIQEWNHNNPLSMDDFQKELKQFKSAFDFYLPKNVIWLQEGFTTDITPDIHLWIENDINIDCVSKGLEKVAFVVGKDVMAHLNVYNFFEEVKSCINPKHFAGRQEAINWVLTGKYSTKETLNHNDIEISYLGKTSEGKSQYSLETSSENTEATLKFFKHILKENTFLKENASRFYSLTQREVEVFELYAKGELIKDIAEQLFLSELTVRTHWRNIKKKLQIKSHSDIFDYKNSFLR